MSNPVTASRKQRLAQRDAVGEAAGGLARARAALDAARSLHLEEKAFARLERGYDRALARLSRAKREETVTLSRLELQLGKVRGSPIERIAELEADVPVAFFPVRIETRFRRGTSEGEGVGELMVRIYPDSILANEHEPLLTGAEAQAGRDYWRRAWLEGDERDAWTILLKQAMAPRAAWIVARTMPANQQERPASGPSPAPQFATIETRPDGWHRAPEATGMPERWIVSAYRGGRRIHQVLSEPVREGLALTFRLSGEGTEEEAVDEFVDVTGDGLKVEPSVLWAYDFSEAVRAGMALTIPLTQADLDRGFSHLIVMGVRTSAEAEEQAADLAALITAVNATRGVAFVPQGAKTNNSADNPSDYPPADTAGAISFATHRGSSLAIAGGDGERFMRALGLPPATADHVWGADRDEQKAAVAMIDCLWPATLGYFLREMMAPDVSPAMADALRVHMREHVRGRGPYSAFRVGPAPYGLLPVSPIFAWSGEPAGEGLEAVMPGALQRLARIWLTASEGVPRIGRSGDPDADLIATLAMDASAQEAPIRHAFGYDATWNLWHLFGLDPARLDEARADVAAELLEAIGGPGWNPRVLHLNFANWARDFAGPLIEDAPLSETEHLVFNYLNWLRNASPADLRQQQPAADPPVTALLYLMLRHGLLAEFDASARHLLEWRGLLLANEVREAELVFVVEPGGRNSPKERNAWERLETQLPGVTGDLTIGEFLRDRTAAAPSRPQPVQDAAQRLQAFRTALQQLEDLPTAELHRLFTETLDVTSHRLDAWLVGLYTKRLEQMREQRGEGVYVGCYGWVENLRADPPGDRVSASAPDGTSVEARTDSGGYVYAPSMLHGAAAAVLRSAYLSRAGDDREPYAIDLSSRRVRTALWLIDTVREDQPLGGALGYQFERGLHERHPGVELDKFLDGFRQHYALVANKAEDSGAPSESVAARNVVDGLRLHAAFRDGAIPFGTPGLSPNATERAAIDQELALLDDAIDAVSDLMTAESVYQVIKGSTAGAAASLDTLAKGKRAPEIEVASVPRSGTVLHQRCAVAFGNIALSPAWAAIPPTPRATAAPELNAWLGHLFGPPDRIACAVDIEGQAPRDVTAADLSLQPIDLYHLARGAETGSAGSDLDRLIAWHAAAGAGTDLPIAIDYAAALAPAAVAFAELFEIASAIGRVLGYARPLRPSDLLPPELESRASEADVMGPELGARAAAARVALGQAIEALELALADIAAAPAGSSPDLAPLRAALVPCARLGVPGAVPPGRHDPSSAAREALVAQGNGALATLSGRRDAADLAGDAAEKLQAIFTRSFIVIPRFRPAAVEMLAPALAREPDLDGSSDADIEGWLHGLSRVREPIAAWRFLTTCERAFGRLSARPRIVQLPLVTQPALARWAALPIGAGQRHSSGLVSLALSGEAVPQADEAWSGLLLDSWPELIPNVEEDAGVVFHYDAPGAQAPQAVLLAVPPPGTKKWSFELLEATLFHALDLARIRCVDLSNLPGLGQILPTGFLAANPANATIATSFAGLLRSAAVIQSREP